MKNVSGKPLQGWRVLVTRASKQADGLAEPLRELGAQVIEVPTIEIEPPRSYVPLDHALRRIDQYDWLILTSVNGVEALFDRLKKLKLSKARLKHLQVAAIGPATQKAIESQGLKVQVTPEKYIAESVVEALRGRTEGKRILLVRARIARDVLPNELKKSAAVVDVIEAYETKVPAGARQKLEKIFAGTAGRPDVITFTSSSTVNNFLGLLGDNPEKLLQGVHMASIGPVTSGTLKKAGFKPSIEAHEYTMEGLVAAIVEKKRTAQGNQHASA
jgi:uroporphyrinogen-III synthase